VRGSLRFHLFGTLVLLPVIVAAVITANAIRLFHEDKELYIFDLSAQSVELVARNLAGHLESLRIKAALGTGTPAPFISIIRHGDAARLESPRQPTYRIQHVGGTTPRLRIEVLDDKVALLTMEIPPESLLDLRGYGGPTQLMVVNRQGRILVHSDRKRVGQSLSPLLGQLHPFSSQGAGAGTRQIQYRGRPTLAAFARVGDDLAVLQTMDRQQVGAAAKPLVTGAIIASLVVVGIAIVIALLLGHSIIRPLRLMARQADAIGRGEFGVAVQADSTAEMAQLLNSFNAMSAALKRREEELQQMQSKLLQSERLNATSRMMTNIVKEVSQPLEQCFQLASQTLHRLPESSALRNMQKQIMEEANRASNILQNLSRLSSAEEPAAQAMEPDIIISDVLVSSRPLFDKQQLTVTTDLDAQIGRVPLSPEQLRNALLDIFLHVTTHARPPTPVQVTLKRQNQSMLLDVLYSGSSPPGSEQPLAAATSLLQEQGGTLSLQPSPRGNRIQLTLPIG